MKKDKYIWGALLLIFTAVLVIGFVMMANSCGSITIDPASTSLSRTTNQPTVVFNPKTGEPIVLNSTDAATADAHGAGYKGPADSKGNIDGSSPKVKLGDASGEGGDTGISWSAVLNPAQPLLWVGLICILGGGFLIWKVALTPGLIAIGSGIGFMAAAVYPWLLLLAAIGVVALVVYYAFRAGYFREGGRALIASMKQIGVTKQVVDNAEANHAVGTDMHAIGTMTKMEASA